MKTKYVKLTKPQRKGQYNKQKFNNSRNTDTAAVDDDISEGIKWWLEEEGEGIIPRVLVDNNHATSVAVA